MEAPNWLDAVAVVKWDELLNDRPELASQPNELAMLCEAWSSYLSAVRDIQSMGLVIRAGERVWNNPAVATKEQERKAIIKLAQLLGLIRGDKGDDMPSPLRAIMENR